MTPLKINNFGNNIGLQGLSQWQLSEPSVNKKYKLIHNFGPWLFYLALMSSKNFIKVWKVKSCFQHPKMEMCK